MDIKLPLLVFYFQASLSVFHSQLYTPILPWDQIRHVQNISISPGSEVTREEMSRKTWGQDGNDEWDTGRQTEKEKKSQEKKVKRTCVACEGGLMKSERRDAWCCHSGWFMGSISVVILQFDWNYIYGSVGQCYSVFLLYCHYDIIL